MKYAETDIQNKLKSEVSDIVPDVLDQVMTACENGSNKVLQMPAAGKQKKWMTAMISIAACAAFLACGVFGYTKWQNGNKIDTTIEFDVNPSIEMSANSKDKVLDVKALNNDAEIILDNMDLKGVKLDVATYAIIGSMLEHGYISKEKNSVLVTVDNADREKSANLQKSLVDMINGQLKENSIEGSVLTQALQKNEDCQKIADQYGISLGKAALIYEICKANSKFTPEDLADLNINQLNLLINSIGITSDQVTSVGSASDKGYIAKDKAQEIALNHAGLTASQVKSLEVEFDSEKGKFFYEVEFRAGDKEYEYDIDATSGEIVKSKTKPIDVDDKEDDKDDDQDDLDDSDDDDDDDNDDDHKNVTTTTKKTSASKTGITQAVSTTQSLDDDDDDDFSHDQNND